MPQDFSTLDQNAQYDILKKVVDTIHKRDAKYKNDSSCEFLEDGKVNLIGVRGFDGTKAVPNVYNKFNDTIFVVSKKNNICSVKSFVASTDYGADSATAFLIAGQHKYQLLYHKKSKKVNGAWVPTDLQPIANGWASGHKYRALNPYPSVRIQRDTNHNRKIDADESAITLNATINIHFGGSRENVGANSHGCQVIKGWGKFKEFLKLVEEDDSIKGSIDNEVAPKPTTNGTRPVIYTLVTGDELSEIMSDHLNGVGKGSFPTAHNGSNKLTLESTSDYYKLTEEDTPGGYFPVGANSLWHGGLHLRGDLGTPVHACMNGTIIAARLCATEDTAIKRYGSRNFILLKHTYKSKPLYSLYMHLNHFDMTDDVLTSKTIEWLHSDEKIVYTVKDGKTIKLMNDVGFSSNPSNTKKEDLSAGTKCTYIESKDDPSDDEWFKIKTESGSIGYIYNGHAQSRADKDVVASIDTEKIDQLKNGEVISCDAPVLSGAKLWEMGVNGSEGNRAPMLHWELFSDDNLFKDVDGYTEIIDADNDYNLDSNKIVELFSEYNEEPWYGNNTIEMNELINFYKESPQKVKLRNYCCKFISEWGIPDIEKAVEAMGGYSWTQPEATDIEPYVWWNDAVTAGVPLPASAHVWHYNPITIMKQLVDEIPAVIPEGDATEPAVEESDEFNIDWSLIQKFEGTKNNMYVPTKDGVVIANSGPTIASGFDLGQRDLNGLKEFDIDQAVEDKLAPYVNMKKQAALDYVTANPLELTDAEILEINTKVKTKEADKAETYYNNGVTGTQKKFKAMPKEVQTSFASAFFQYGSACPSFRKHLIAEDYKKAVNELLTFTSKTETITHKTTNATTELMPYLARRCREARVLVDIVSAADKESAQTLITEKETAWAAAFGKAIYWSAE